MSHIHTNIINLSYTVIKAFDTYIKQASIKSFTMKVVTSEHYLCISPYLSHVTSFIYFPSYHVVLYICNLFSLPKGMLLQ